MAGSFAGGLLYERSVLAMLAASAVLIGVGAVGMTAERRLFDVPVTGLR
jgi:predicted MFS family arabinose efflux permease